ncbi:MAG TPA: hypothetical protein VHM94_11175 [Acidimicrobiia bacterium]|nr:hypothetical protein [Acidimicrobiia bacterium]
MRVAVRPTDDVGRRAVHVLLADRTVEAVGLLGTQPSHTAGGRLQPVDSAEGWDVLVLDADPNGEETTIPVIGSTKPELWLLAALASTVGREQAATVSAWTEPGSPLTAGTRVRFPDPVGPLLAVPAERPERALVGDYMRAPGAEEPWIGLSVTGNGGGLIDRVAVVEHADFLRGVTLAAAAMATVQTGGWKAPGFWRALIEIARRRGLVMAAPSRHT